MGEVIRKDAAVADILADVRTTLRHAKERGGDAHKLADERLAPTALLADDVSARLVAALSASAPLEAALDAADDAADRLLRRVADDVWNDVGRPASDPALDILFPGGVDYYADGDVDGQPQRMELLAELLASGIHPRLPKARAEALASEVRAGAATLRAKVESAAPERARVALLGRVQTALARTSQVQLSNLKRMYKAVGLTEVEIHKVIPDRPKRVAKAAAPSAVETGTET